ncbi:MAG: hypothetical protein M3300_02200, partial [Actinomycetota bacterium]|nr:hypothetical protein [Actinomycetota bacterium]
MPAGPDPAAGASGEAGPFMGAGASGKAGAFMGAGAGEAPESAVSAPDASVLRVDDELDPLLRSGEVAAAGAGAVAAAADVVAGAEA